PSPRNVRGRPLASCAAVVGSGDAPAGALTGQRSLKSRNLVQGVPLPLVRRLLPEYRQGSAPVFVPMFLNPKITRADGVALQSVCEGRGWAGGQAPDAAAGGR